MRDGLRDYCQGADLCDEIAGKLDVSFNRTYQGNPPSRRIATTREFVLVADLSPLIIGHLLLLPKRHYLSFAQVLGEHARALEEVLLWLLPTYNETFGPPAILEHGSSKDTDHSACISHAHLHLLPVDGNHVDAVMTQDGLIPTDLVSLRDLGQQPWIDSSYLFHSCSARHRVYKPLDGMRRQYIRSVVGRILSMNDPEWDHAVIVRRELLRTTMRLVSHWNVPKHGI